MLPDRIHEMPDRENKKPDQCWWSGTVFVGMEKSRWGVSGISLLERFSEHCCVQCVIPSVVEESPPEM